MSYRRTSLDLDQYANRTQEAARAGRCFLCAIVAGERDDHFVVFRDDVCVGFLARFPTLVGVTLVAPLDHRTNVVGDFTEDEYIELQRRIHRIGAAITGTVPTERLYVLSLGSQQGNSHVHWHLAPLPPGIPYREQQYAALMHENGHLDIPDADLASLARSIAAKVDRA